MTRLLGIIGKPVKHSISPVFQQAALDYYGLDVCYEAWETAPDELIEVVNTLRWPTKLGANITIPYKEAVLPCLDEVDETALRIGAVNTVVNSQGQLNGYNTDVVGFYRSLREAARFDAGGKDVVVLGAGGAARAVTLALIWSKAAHITVCNRTYERALKLVEDFRTPDIASKLTAVPMTKEALGQVLHRCHLLVNCTSVGMRHGDEEQSAPIPGHLIPSDILVYDIVANPLETPLMEIARGQGAKTMGGLSMLVYQGAASFELWTGLAAPLEVMQRAARQAMGLAAEEG